jgi:hypothetical protein
MGYEHGPLSGSGPRVDRATGLFHNDVRRPLFRCGSFPVPIVECVRELVAQVRGLIGIAQTVEHVCQGVETSVLSGVPGLRGGGLRAAGERAAVAGQHQRHGQLGQPVERSERRGAVVGETA